MQNWLTRNIVWLFIAIASLWIGGVVIQGLAAGHHWIFANVDFELAGAFGDSFGGLSAFMATAAAIGAWQAVRYQREELESARSREQELDRISSKRDFETTFFNMLNLLRSVVNEVRFENNSGSDIFQGREGLYRILAQTRQRVVDQTLDWEDSFEKSYNRHRDDLAHYFRLLYHIVLFIEDSSVENKKTYIRILRATLSNSEIVLLGLNCMFGGGRIKFKPLVEKYALLHNISARDARDTLISKSFDASAFGDRSIGTDGYLAD